MGSEEEFIVGRADDGTVGYVRKADLYGDEPSPLVEEAGRDALGPQPVLVYGADRKTVIGTFTLQ